MTPIEILLISFFGHFMIALIVDIIRMHMTRRAIQKEREAFLRDVQSLAGDPNRIESDYNESGVWS